MIINKIYTKFTNLTWVVEHIAVDNRPNFLTDSNLIALSDGDVL